jgi:hypothetical protein
MPRHNISTQKSYLVEEGCNFTSISGKMCDLTILIDGYNMFQKEKSYTLNYLMHRM